MSTMNTTKPFPWRAGMRCRFEDWEAPVRILAADHEEAWVIHENAAMPIAFVCSLDSLHSPDGEDGATKGALLDVIRAERGDPQAYCMFSRTIGAWVVSIKGREPVESYVSEFDALMAARAATP